MRSTALIDKCNPATRKAAAPTRNKTVKSFLRFGREETAAVTVLFGLMAIAMFAMIGLAVDYGRWLNARDQTVSAADSAVLAAARALQTNGGDKIAAVALARKYYESGIKSRITVKTDTINFVVDPTGTKINTTGNATLDTPFMSFAGTDSLPLYHSDGTDYSQAVLAVGANAETSLETSLILDISGSMAIATPTLRQRWPT